MEEHQHNTIGTLVEPEPIGFSFDAPGWSILIGILVLVLILIGVIRYLQYRKNKYRREAVSGILDLFNSNPSPEHLVFQLTQVLKRVSISSYGRAEVAHLNGAQWLDYLSKKNNEKRVFSPALEKIFSESLYRGRIANLDVHVYEELKATSIHWINKHHV